MVLPWKEEYNLGIASVDEQHREFIGIINTLAKNLSQGLSHGDIVSAIIRMENYVQEHCLYEEKCFVVCSYEEMDAHIAEHKIFLEKAKEFRERVNVDDPLVAVEMLGFFEKWFLEHELVEDRKYVEAFRICGIR